MAIRGNTQHVAFPLLAYHNLMNFLEFLVCLFSKGLDNISGLLRKRFLIRRWKHWNRSKEALKTIDNCFTKTQAPNKLTYWEREPYLFAVEMPVYSCTSCALFGLWKEEKKNMFTTCHQQREDLGGWLYPTMIVPRLIKPSVVPSMPLASFEEFWSAPPGVRRVMTGDGLWQGLPHSMVYRDLPISFTFGNDRFEWICLVKLAVSQHAAKKTWWGHQVCASRVLCTLVWTLCFSGTKAVLTAPGNQELVETTMEPTSPGSGDSYPKIIRA
jgi:hypothetical protein